MKKVSKNFKLRPGSIVAGYGPYEGALDKLVREGHWPDNSSSLYRSSRVKKELDKVYKNKCAYCGQIPSGSALQVEHFRPKNGVKGVNDTGYYWLGYEWSNLLYACGNCNSRKGTQFKIGNEKNRVTVPDVSLSTQKILLEECFCKSKRLQDEQHFLVNPETDDPDEHFVYLPDGKIYYKSSRGRYSIDVYKLNRDELYVDGRKKLLDSIVQKISTRLIRYNNKEKALRETVDNIADIIVENIIKPIHECVSFDHFLYAAYKGYDIYFVRRFKKNGDKMIVNYVFKKCLSYADVRL